MVGAGLAGLNCARLLAQAGIPFVVVEAGACAGGRLQTQVTADGFQLDRRFQTVFSAYPALRRALGTLKELSLRPFDSGVAVVSERGLALVHPPLRHPRHALSALTSRALTWGDRRRLLQLALGARVSPWDGVRDVYGTPRTALMELRACGFSPHFVNGFWRPFLEGLFLERDLETSADAFRFVVKMLVEGQAALPARGMRAIPEALLRRLPAGAVRYRTEARELLHAETGEILGVALAGDEPVGARAVVVATDGRSAVRLTRLPLPAPSLGCTTLYLAGRRRLYERKLLALNARQDRYVSHAALLTNVAPEYAPPGWHLLEATVVGVPDDSDEAVERKVRADLARWWPREDLSGWRTLAIQRLPHALLRQPPDFAETLVGPRTAIPGLYLAGELTQDSSINGALKSGEEAARAVAADLGYALLTA